MKSLFSPVFARAHLPEVLSSPVAIVEPPTQNPSVWEAYLGTISLNSSNFIRPAGVSPIWMSMKTIGRVVEGDEEAMVVVVEQDARRVQPTGTAWLVGILRPNWARRHQSPRSAQRALKSAMNGVSSTKRHNCEQELIFRAWSVIIHWFFLDVKA